ncbi:MAG: hypothetical protein ABIF77_00040 [bacterium]
MRQANGSLLLLLTLIAALLAARFLTACNQEPPPTCPLHEVGAVEGFIRSSGVGVAAEIRVSEYGDSGPYDVNCTVWSDSTGWYRIELPTGLYGFKVHYGGNYIYSNHEPDTIRVAPSIHRFDIDRCRTEIRIQMPGEFPDREFRLRVRGPRVRNARQTAEVAEGMLSFVFPLMIAGTYCVSLESTNTGFEFYLPGTMNPAEAESLTIIPDSTNVFEFDLSASYASISGRVIGSWQEAGAYLPRIEVYSTDAWPIATAGCEPDGAFSCDIFVLQPVRLRVSCTDVVQWLGGDTYETARVFDLHSGDRITDVEVVESGLLVSLEGPGNLTVHECTILIRDELGREIALQPYSQGAYTICNLQPKRYYLQVDGRCHDQIWIPQWYDGAATLAEATPIDLGEAELKHLVITLEEGGRIEGRVLEVDGRPPNYVTCSIFDATGEPLCAYRQQWHDVYDGYFRFAGLVDGDYYLAARDYVHDLWWYPGTLLFSEATPVTIQYLATVTGISWFIPPFDQEAQP